MPKLDFLALDRFSSLTQPLRLSIDYQLLAQSLHIDSGTLAFTALHLPLLPATYFPLVPFDPAAPFRVAAYAQNLSLKPVTTLFVDHVDTFFGVCLCGPEMVGELEGVVLETGVLLGDVMGYCGLEDFLTDMHLFHLLLDAGHEVAEDNFGGLFTFVAGPDSPANLAGAGVDGQPAPSILITD